LNFLDCLLDRIEDLGHVHDGYDIETIVRHKMVFTLRCYTIDMTLRSILHLRCPVCEKGRLFQGYFDTPERCPECGYFFMRENGYFLPHVAIGYGATVVVALGMWPLLYFVVGVRSDRILLGSMVLAGLSFGTWFVRYAKMLWLALDLKLNPPSREDFQSRGRD